MTELDLKVVQLKEIFRQGDPLEERRVSVNKINACVRGWLQRIRYNSYKRGLREWKWLRCRQIVWLLDMNLGLQVSLSYKRVFFSILVVSYFMRSGALDSSGVLQSYSIISLA